MNEHFNKNVIMSVEDEKRFQSSNKCWICSKSFTNEDKKVRDHDHITGRYRGSPHSDCNINLKLAKKILKLVKKKGIYPYEYINSFEKFF